MAKAPNDLSGSKHGTEEGHKRLQAYHYALGRFVDMFAKAELGAHLVLRHYAQMSIGAARALLSGVRVDETKSRLQRLFEAGEIDENAWKHAEPIFQQLGIINGARNDILHHGAISIEEGDGLVTNAAMAHIPERITGFPISPEILDDMTADLRKIILHMFWHHAGLPSPWDGKSEMEAKLHAPWRYKQRPKPLVGSKKSAPKALAKSKAPSGQPLPSAE